MAGSIALVAAGAVVAAVAAVVKSDEGDVNTPVVEFVETWVASWNDRDAQAVSSMTCHYIPAFVPAGIIEDILGRMPDGGPVVADHAVTGTEPAVVLGRTGVNVQINYVPGGSERVQERAVFVRVRDDGDMCIGSAVHW